MRTTRLLPVSPGMHCSGRGGVPGPRGVCTWSRGVYLVEGMYVVQGVYLVLGGVLGPWGECTWSQGVYLVQGGVPGSGGVYLVQAVCTWSRGVCTWSQGVYLVLGVHLVWGVYLVLQGVPGPRGCIWSWGVYLVWGWTWSWGGVPAQVLPSCGQNSWHTLLKILPCPKLRLRAVTKHPVYGNIHCVHEVSNNVLVSLFNWVIL